MLALKTDLPLRLMKNNNVLKSGHKILSLASRSIFGPQFLMVF